MRAPLTALVLAVAACGVAAAPLADADAAARKRVLVCQSSRSAANKGTVVGGITGGVLGAAVAGHGNKTEGALLGGTVGAVAGHQIAKKKKCHYVYR